MTEFEALFYKAESLSSIMQREPVQASFGKTWLVQHFWHPIDESILSQLYEELQGQGIHVVLRRMRPLILAHCLLGDLSGKASLEGIMHTMSAFADLV